jgi:hypothetical protein
MRHDELLEEFDRWIRFLSEKNKGKEWVKALRAVVELHKPDKEGLCAMNCVEVDDDGYAWTQVAYPCLTIQTIEKELK